MTMRPLLVGRALKICHGDQEAAEDLVQDAYVALCSRSHHNREPWQPCAAGSAPWALVGALHSRRSRAADPVQAPLDNRPGDG